MGRKARFLTVIVILAAGVVAAMALGLSLGSEPVPFHTALAVLVGRGGDSTAADIAGLRLQRVILAAITGAGLSVAGVALQALLRNPLADPYILGVSGGAAVGAAVFTTLTAAAGWAARTSEIFGFGGRAAFALAGALLASFVVLLAGRRRGHIMPATLLLVGVMVNAICGSAVLALTYLADPARAHAIVVWLMGNIGTLTLPPSAIVVSGAVITVLSALLWLYAARLNILSLGEESAATLGVSVRSTRTAVFILSAVVTGVSVALVGPIGFVGLVAPHITRVLTGSDHRFLFPASMLFGAGFLILADTLARTIKSGEELPVGVLTAALGGPFFIWLLRTRRGRYFE